VNFADLPNLTSKIDLYFLPHENYTRQTLDSTQLASLEQFLIALNALDTNFSIWINMEFKDFTSTLTTKTLALLKYYNRTSRVIWGSESSDVYNTLKTIAPDIYRYPSTNKVL